MPANISFALTLPQIQNEMKTVTRRDGWRKVKPGQLLWAVDKTMGLKAGEHPTRLKLIRVVSTQWEPLLDITPEDVVREGFPGWTPAQFIEMYCAAKPGRTPNMLVNRIEFRYLWLEPEPPVWVPEKLAVCPKCGGKLAIMECAGWVEGEPGLLTPHEIHLACEHEPDIEGETWEEWFNWHYDMPYVDWLPVEMKVLKWFARMARYVR